MRGDLVAGGLTSVEITFRTDAAVEAIRRASRIEGLLVGAGTVLSVEQLDAALDAGAQFAVAPSTDPVVIEAAQRAGVLFIPGAATPTEIDRARSLGCDVVKIFPASLVGGPAFVKAVSPVFPDVKFVPTGGDHRREPRRLSRPSLGARVRRHVDHGAARRHRGACARGGRRSREHPARGGVPLRPRRARRGDAPARPRRRPHRDDAERSPSRRAAASTTSPAASAAASACAPRS